ncbi:MAG: preprotein translocase subunit SecG [Bacteroidetes bacterium]|nr:preprotein translocase subunit SecG [Bacteroidota bacterium]
MIEVITIIILIVCFLLGAIVLIQNPKGGGLSASFGQAGNQLLGFQRSTDIVEKWTWGLLVAIFVLTLSTSAFINRSPVSTQPGNFAPQADPSLVITPPTSAAPAPSLTPAEQAPTEQAPAE